MATSGTSSILGQYEANLKAQSGTDRVATDKDTFLKLLVAQLTHQDPLNPVEDKEFIAQLAQFTQVEELQNIGTGIESLNASFLAQQTTNAASLIGREVLAGGDNIYLRNADQFASTDDYPYIYFTLPAQSSGGMFSVYNMNEDGSIGTEVYSEKMGNYSAGTHPAKWHGRHANGQVMPNGYYVINITAKDVDGNDMLVTRSSNGVVVGVETSSDGNHMLYLGDGRKVDFTDVQLITVATYNNGGEDTDADADTDTDTNTDTDTTP